MRARPGFGPLSSFARATQRGGHFARPVPKPYKLYTYSRRLHLEDVNTILYNDFAPEFHMHLHSIQIQQSKQGYFLVFCFFMAVLLPGWLFARYVHQKMGNMLFPTIRPGSDHDHMAPRLYAHLRANDCEQAPDFFGRRNAQFYKNWCRQTKDTPMMVRKFNDHGFNF